jgi:multicomponent Na+:H+ antiporter subunit E
VIGRVIALWMWAAAVGLILTWTVTFEQLVTGGLIAAGVAATMWPMGEVARPWRLLDPRRLLAALRLFAEGLMRIAKANVSLARRIWAPSRPLRSGMVIVPTGMRTEGGVGGLGLITSLIVDNQITDVDLGRHELQYHAVSVPDGEDAKVAEINGPVERLLGPLVRRR